MALLPFVGQFADKVLIAPYAVAFLPGLLAWEWDRLSWRSRLVLGAAILAMMTLSPRYGGFSVTAPAVAVIGFIGLRWATMRVPRIFTWIGMISYPLYLVHNEIGWVVIRELSGAPLMARYIAGFAAGVALAYALHLTVEGRWRKPVEKAFERAFDAFNPRRMMVRSLRS